MSLFLKYLFLFFIGSTLGWIVELFFRRLAHKKWVNPGFLIGPYLPIYGFGLCFLTLIYTLLQGYSWWLNIILMGVTMTILELIGGLCFLKTGVKLWDYSNMPLNYKGIICPTFSAIWTIVGALYYFFLASPVNKMLNWFASNLSFSFVLGAFFGLILVDYIKSTQLFFKIKKYAKDNDLEIKYEELKLRIKEHKEKRKEKYSFFFSFNNIKTWQEYLEEYKKDKNKKKIKIFSSIRKKVDKNEK